ncbi:hypothetical protein SSP531S_43440 [Streptomyces spongiicola]|uniref:Uncharacterized protein n=1 Tax=Streptomyces spongiicola TaxID=1690221 RepID=A0A388T4F1_9ACTN|nr:hypothetical protein SSP531S_43440 [Streptomyces spongiicola]
MNRVVFPRRAPDTTRVGRPPAVRPYERRPMAQRPCRRTGASGRAEALAGAVRLFTRSPVHRFSFEDAPAFRPGRNRSSRVAGHGIEQSPSGRLVVSTHRTEDGLKQVDDLGVEGPPVGPGLLDEAFMQVSGQTERDPLLRFHATMMP